MKLYFIGNLYNWIHLIKDGPDCLEKPAVHILIKNIFKDFDLFGNDFDITETGDLEYQIFKKSKEGNEIKIKTTVGLQRGLTRLFKTIGQEQKANIIDALARRLKAFILDKTVTVHLIFGEDIKTAYDARHVLGFYSCMSDIRTLEYLSLYSQNPNTVCMLACVLNNTIAARCLVWILDNGVVSTDRIYANTPEYEMILKNYINNPQTRAGLLDIKHPFFNHENLDPETIDIWTEKIADQWFIKASGNVILDVEGLSYMPYLDTYYYVEKYDSTSILISTCYSEYSAQQTEGQLKRDCDTCEGSGKVECYHCEGTGRIECDMCNGTGECQECDGQNSEDNPCEYCNNGNYCQDCMEGYLPCTECKEKNSTEDYGTGKEECPDCGGSGEVYMYLEDL